MKLHGVTPEGMKRLAKVAQMDEEPMMGGGLSDVEDLVLFIDNSGELYPQTQEIQKSLIQKIQRGVYDSDQAPQLWSYLVEAGAKQYVQEMNDGMSWFQKFPPEVRQEAAQMMAEEFDEEISFAGDEDLNEHFGV